MQPTSQPNRGPHHTGISGPLPMESPAHLDRNTQGKERDMNNLEVSSLVRKIWRERSLVHLTASPCPRCSVRLGSKRLLPLIPRRYRRLYGQGTHSTPRTPGPEWTHNASSREADRLVPHQIDLVKDLLGRSDYGSAGGIINVHFTLPALFPFFADSLDSKRVPAR
jgi:hypothetical protein